MNASFDGMRIGQVRAFNDFTKSIDLQELTEEQLEKLDELSSSIGVMLCCFDNDKDDYNMLYDDWPLYRPWREQDD